MLLNKDEKLVAYLDEYHQRVKEYDAKIEELNELIKMCYDYMELYHRVINKLKQDESNNK